jgi:hypothetical protein
MATPTLRSDNPVGEVIYTVLAPQDHETSHISLNPNLLVSSNKPTGSQYQTSLREYSETSLTVKNNIVLFGATLVLFCLVALVTHTVAYFRKESLDQKTLIVHIVCLLGLTGLGGSLVVALWAFESLRNICKKLYFAYFLLLCAYLVLGDQRVLSKITDSDYSSVHSDYTEALMLFLYLYMRVSWAYFRGMTVLSVYVLVLYLSLMLIYSPQSDIVSIANFLYLAVYCLLLCVYTYQAEFHARNTYYRIAREENTIPPSLPVENKPISGYVGISTATERLIDLCNVIADQVKSVAFTLPAEGKSQLTAALLQLDKIKQRLSEGKLHEVDRFDPTNSIDEEDREFIQQQVGQRPMLSKGMEQLVSRFISARIPLEVKAEDLGADM